MLNLRSLILVATIMIQPIPSGVVSPAFDFHSNFWINLHHFLYHEAQPKGPPPRAPATEPIGTLSVEEKQTWDSAIAYYREHIIQHDVLFDEHMSAIKTTLASRERDSSMKDIVLGHRLAEVLNHAAPIYRKHWWPTHDAANSLWISSVQQLIGALGGRLGNELERAYETPWYPDPIRVDVSPFAGTRLVAYTTGTTHGHIVISSTDPCDQGFGALETLFHEASHTIVQEESGSVGTSIHTASAALRAAPPDGLWHALMFYTQGALIRRDLAELGLGYEPAAGLCNVYTGSWNLYRDALALFWQPHLDGRLPLDSAIAGMVGALASARSR